MLRTSEDSVWRAYGQANIAVGLRAGAQNRADLTAIILVAGVRQALMRPSCKCKLKHVSPLAAQKFVSIREFYDIFRTITRTPAAPTPKRMASDKELADFLAGVERRAFKQTVYAVRDDDASLDIVQDAMIKLAEKYGDRPAAELPLLFQRILQNAMHDYFRRAKVRNTWISLFSSLGNADDDEFDPLETFEAAQGSAGAESNEQKLEREQVLQLIDDEIRKLPARQREAFLMRYWEDMDVAETAAAMGCSEGSVKTHCSRATHTLAQALKAKGITL
ncbi:RNA polymerase sigma factor, sigma-70 family [Paraburkholderia susongensis]|uniref:RNA polymerase sigma factor, sigma-70 family n=2 Tax=Paraburkholderia susongensis TaxID=1515439 RepID=A0A1X7KZS2_9BURK|nr:RNA polymerase sigma factor, sigma-70 family [Paraburkholderia susongensis]